MMDAYSLFQIASRHHFLAQPPFYAAPAGFNKNTMCQGTMNLSKMLTPCPLGTLIVNLLVHTL